MTLGKLKKFCAAIHEKTEADLTRLGVDLFLVAANNVKANAQLLHNFELSRVRATLDVDPLLGGALVDAVIDGEDAEPDIIITGTLSPNATGTYTYLGTYLGYDFWRREDGAYVLFHDPTTSVWLLQVPNAGFTAQTNRWQYATSETIPEGLYSAQGSYTGVPVISLSNLSRWSGLKEIIAVQRGGPESALYPLDFTRLDVSIERDRYETELSDIYDPYNRYPSDAQLLNRGANGSVVQRGSSLFIYPLGTNEGDPVPLTLEGYGMLADYVAGDLLTTEPTDFLVEHGHVYMQWAIVCELNYFFKTFVARQEGNLATPEKEREDAWRRLILWDSYLIDSHSTRSR